MYVTYRVTKNELITVICVSIIGFLENITACAVILCSRSTYTITNYYLLSLAISDILILIIHVLEETCILFDSCSQAFFFTKYWKSHLYIIHGILVTAVNASTLVVTAFTSERYLAICHPFRARAISTSSRVKKIIVGLWLFAAFFASVSILLEFLVILILEHQHAYSRIGSIFFKTLPYIQVTLTIFNFFIPMIAITVMYVLIAIELKKISNMRLTITSVDNAAKKNLKMFVFIVVAFFLCWAPYYIGNIMEALLVAIGWDYDILNASILTIIEVRNITVALYPTLNPLIYTLMSEKFREDFKDLLSRMKGKIPGSTINSMNTEDDVIPLDTIPK